jgi:putative zinc finger/helix-turn-helix YgiT family protein
MKNISCPSCRESEVSTTMERGQFVFRSGGINYNVSADVPVHSCPACGESFVSEIGESARHEAICHAMRRLTPQEIYSLRERLSLSRKSFAELSGIGEASLARWESGELIQSESNDNLLRLLASDDNVRTLRQLRNLNANETAPIRTHQIRRDTAVASPEDNVIDIARYSGLRSVNGNYIMQQSARFRLKYAG